LFFPDGSLQPSDGSQWKHFWDLPGYLGEYHQILEGLEGEDQEELDANIAELLCHIQRLPNSQVYTLCKGTPPSTFYFLSLFIFLLFSAISFIPFTPFIPFYSFR
jgi:hypothetical protein